MDSLGLARTWLNTCCESHAQCRSDSNGRLASNFQLPTRLLDIRSNVPRLTETSNYIWVDRPHYATLSHCWGTEQFLCLTTDNVGRLTREGIALTELTKTFQDAITIARAVGLDYIWIDSLCIVQDDLGDWYKEAAAMSSVYSGSTLNIAASSAKSGKDGCFLKPQYFSDGFYAECSIGGQKAIRLFHNSGSFGPFYGAIDFSHL